MCPSFICLPACDQTFQARLKAHFSKQIEATFMRGPRSDACQIWGCVPSKRTHRPKLISLFPLFHWAPMHHSARHA